MFALSCFLIRGRAARPNRDYKVCCNELESSSPRWGRRTLEAQTALLRVFGHYNMPVNDPHGQQIPEALVRQVFCQVGPPDIMSKQMYERLGIPASRAFYMGPARNTPLCVIPRNTPLHYRGMTLWTPKIRGLQGAYIRHLFIMPLIYASSTYWPRTPHLP